MKICLYLIFKKIIALPSILGEKDLGVGAEIYNEMVNSVGVVIHLAWAVNFNIGVDSFEAQHIAGAHNLIQLCLNSKGPTPAAFYFGSSVSAVAASREYADEKIETDFNRAQSMGYAQSKLVTENMCSAAARETGMVCRMLRIGQIAGDTSHGVWSDTEAIPMMIQSAETIGAIPTLDETPTWLPVDVVANTIIDLIRVPASEAALDSVFHVVNPTSFHWTRDLIPALKAAGLAFEEVDQQQWVQRLRNSNPDPVANPPFKLVDFFTNKYDRADKRPGLYFKTDLACQFSPSLHSAPRIDTSPIGRFVKYWKTQCWTKNGHSATIIIVGGPCGTGKSTVAKALSDAFELPYVDADALHCAASIEKMKSDQPLLDEDRWSWLELVKRRAIEHCASTQGIVVACSALRRRYRDLLRDLPDGTTVRFLMLRAEPAELERRLGLRKGHYMKSSMVQSQVAAVEELELDEVDGVVIDAMDDKSKVIDKAISQVESFGLKCHISDKR